MSHDGNLVTITVPNDAPQVSGYSAFDVSPPFSTSPTLVPVPIDAAEHTGAVWNMSTNSLTRLGGLPVVPSLMVYGSGSSGGPGGDFVSPLGISSNGRFVVGMAYTSSFTDESGQTIGSPIWQWCAYVWDSQANGGAGAYTILPAPMRTSWNTWRRRTAIATCVSDDGRVIVGGQEHNIGSFPDSADPDGGRPAVWRWNQTAGTYDMSFLPMGIDTTTGFPWGTSFTGSSFLMNSNGTTIVGPAADDTGNSIIAKWVWNAGSSSWSAPITICPVPLTPASWLPGAVTSCGLPPVLRPTSMTADGNTVVGEAIYSTCSGFMSGGFIWDASDGITTDWYDYLVAAGTPGVTANYGPIGDEGDPSRGLPRSAIRPGFRPTVAPSSDIRAASRASRVLPRPSCS